jgi:hypothetical protein
MKELGSKIERVLLQPQLVRRSRSDETTRLFYEFYAQTTAATTTTDVQLMHRSLLRDAISATACQERLMMCEGSQ